MAPVRDQEGKGLVWIGYYLGGKQPAFFAAVSVEDRKVPVLVAQMLERC